MKLRLKIQLSQKILDYMQRLQENVLFVIV